MYSPKQAPGFLDSDGLRRFTEEELKAIGAVSGDVEKAFNALTERVTTVEDVIQGLQDQIDALKPSMQPLPMLARPRVCLFGDSTMMQNNVGAVIVATGIYPSAYPKQLHRSGKGFATWAAAYSSARWSWSTWYDPGELDSGKGFDGDNLAFAAEDDATVLLRLRRGLMKRRPQVALFADGINTLLPGCPASIVTDILSRDAQKAALCLSMGCYPVFTTLPGRSPPGTPWPIDITLAGQPDPGWPVGDPRYTYRLQINAGRLAMQTQLAGLVFCANLEPAYVNPANGYWVDYGSDEGIHPSQFVNRPAGKIVADVLNAMILPLPAAFQYIINVSAFNYINTGTIDPSGNIGGGTLGLGVTGGSTVMAGFVLQRSSAGSITVAASLQSILGVAYKAQRMVFTIAGSSFYERFWLRCTIPRPNEPAGTRFKVLGFYTWSASGSATSALASASVYIERKDIVDIAAEIATPFSGQATTFVAEGMHNTSPKDFQHNNIAETDGVWAESEAVELMESTQSITVGGQIDVTNIKLVGGTITVDLSQLKLVAVRDDRVSYTP